MKIIYPTSSGIAVANPSGTLPIDEVARKDVPAGMPYLIVEDSSLPSDLAALDAMTFDFSTPDGHGAEYGAGTDWVVADYDEQGHARFLVNRITQEIGIRSGETVVIAEPEQAPLQSPA